MLFCFTVIDVTGSIDRHTLRTGCRGLQPQHSATGMLSVTGIVPVFQHAVSADVSGMVTRLVSEVLCLVLQALAIFDIVRSNWSDAAVFSSTFDNYTAALIDRLPYLNLPVFTEEIGDTWIYGEDP